MRITNLLYLTALLAGCGRTEATPATGAVVDSVIHRDSAIARFQRATLRVGSFSGGAQTRDALVRQFVTALERGDTVALRSLLLTRSEFGWLYYPGHPESFPPYSLSPQLMWFMLEGNSARGFDKLLRERFGTTLRFVGFRCDGESRQGLNAVWGPCVVLRQLETGDTLAERLFGQIVGRNGIYKFVSYTNNLD